MILILMKKTKRRKSSSMGDGNNVHAVFVC